MPYLGLLVATALAIELFRDASVVNLPSALRVTRLKLWDEHRGRLVSFAGARAAIGTA